MTKRICKWLEYEFTVYEPLEARRQKDGGVYIFAKFNLSGTWNALYIGETESFAERLPNHEKWDRAERMGATHIHLRVYYTEAMRKSVEKELINYYRPPLNDT